jgi:hypothetical protein
MSIRIMSAVWGCSLSGPTKRLVLLALADNANDEGECWPSIATISRKTGLCERATRKAIRDLEADGWLAVQLCAGRRGANKYMIRAAPDAPGTKCPPARNAPHPGTRCPPTPAPDAPEPSFNHQEPSSPLTPHGGARGFSKPFRKERKTKTQTYLDTLNEAMRIVRERREQNEG